MPIQTDHPILLAHARQPDRVRQAISVFRAGLAAGAIRNTEYQAAKGVLSRAVEQAWQASVAAPYFHAGQWERQSPEAQVLNNSCSPSSLHDLLSIARKLRASTCEHPPVQAMRALVAETIGLAEASAELKAMVVKGRAPSPAAARAPNPDQERGTCSCCFRSIAVTAAGRMAHHGYERPGYGVQTSSCSGVRFPPLEVSTEGLEWLIWSVSERRDGLRERLERKDEMESLTFTVRRRVPEAGGRVLEVPQTIRRGAPDWDRRLAEWERAMSAALRQTEHHLEDLEARLELWRKDAPGEAPSP